MKIPHKPVILIVDDEPANVRLLTAVLLRSNRYKTITAFDGKEALEKAHREVPDVILMDISMPGMDGCEVTAALKKNSRTEHIPILLVTALFGTEHRARGLEAGAADYFEKPVDMEKLLSRIESLVV